MIMLALNSSIVFSRMNPDQMLAVIKDAPRPITARSHARRTTTSPYLRVTPRRCC